MHMLHLAPRATRALFVSRMAAACAACGMLMGPALAADPVAETIALPLGGNTGMASRPALGPLVLVAGVSPTRPLVGTSPQGGTVQAGSVYSVTPGGAQAQLYSFTGNADGSLPAWGLARDGAGNFYGVNNGGSSTDGVVFTVTNAGKFKILHTFPSGGAEGQVIDNGITVGRDGFLYGFTHSGGPSGNNGTFYRLARNGSRFAILSTFPGTNAAASNPYASPTEGPDGAFYGIANSYSIVSGVNGYGAVFRVDTTGNLTVLQPFTSHTDEPPLGKVTIDAAGAIYFMGPARTVGMGGRIYKLFGGNLSVVHQFVPADGTPGPYNGCLTLGRDGRLYGVADDGGTNGSFDFGTVYGVGRDGTGFGVLHSFGASDLDGLDPEACPSQAADGSLWGTTFAGGQFGSGVIYKLARPGVVLRLSPSAVTVGGASVLSWSSHNTLGCTISGPSVAATGVSGSVKIVPAAAGTFTYVAACYGAGSGARGVELTVQ